MIPNQIVTGAANPNPNTFSYTHFRDETYFAYSSGSNVYVLRGGALRVVQVLTEHRNDESKTTSFVVGGEQLAIWKLDYEQITRQHAITKQEQMNGSSSTTVLGKAAAEHFSMREQKLFKKQAMITWRTDCSQPVHHIACAPTGGLFATAGKCDRMLKVWYPQKRVVRKVPEEEVAAPVVAAPIARAKGYFKDEFNKLTSREPRRLAREDDPPVVLSPTAIARRAPKQRRFESESYGFIYLPHPRALSSISWRVRGASFHNILLTNCKDGVVRLWQQSFQSNRLQFNVSNIIAAGTETVDWISCLSTAHLAPSTAANPTATNATGASTTTPTPTPANELIANLKNPILLRQKETNLTKKKPVVDWIMAVKPDGALVLWKLRSDDSVSKQTSSISIWINANILSPHEVAPNRMIALYQPLSIADNTPTSITIAVNSFNGAISCRKFFIQNHNHTQIIQAPYFLVDVGSIGTRCTSVAWAPLSPHCVCATPEGILVFHVEGHDHGHRSLKLPIGVIECPDIVDQLHIVEPQRQIIDTPFHLYLIGLGKDGDFMCVWGVSITRATSASGPASVTSELLARRDLDINVRITAFCAAPKGIADDVAVEGLDQNSLSHPLCITGNIEGSVTVWALSHAPNNAWMLNEMCSVDAYQQPVASVKPAYYGRFASTPFTSASSPEVHVWELESHTPRLHLEDTIRFGEVKDMAPCTFSFAHFEDGSTSIALGCGTAIKVLRKPVDRVIGSYRRPWVETHTYTALAAPCAGIAWGRDKELFVATGNQMLVFTKWVRPSDTMISQLDGVANSTDTIYHQHAALARALPYYHPKLLTEYMMAGKFDVVERVLKKVSQYLTTLYPLDDDFDLTTLPTKPVHLPAMGVAELIGGAGSTAARVTGTEDDIDRINSKYFDADNSDDEMALMDQHEDGFTTKAATKLNEILSLIKLSGLASSEQIQLLALADTYGEIGSMRGGLDDNGSKFLLTVKIFQFLRRALAPNERPATLSASDMQWALHSDAQETILQTCFPADPDWESLRQMGAGLWIKSASTLRLVIDKLAKTTYMANKEPSDAALYYIALGKRGALIALHRMGNNVKHVEFLSQDFTQTKWINAAAKSAYLLQSKHKYDLAASMFLLAGDLKQAINLILQVKGDFQLAYVIARLHEGEGGVLAKSIIDDHIVPHAKKTGDRCLLSVCNWLAKRHEDSLKVLLPSTIIDDSGRRLDETGESVTAGWASPTLSSSSRSSVINTPPPTHTSSSKSAIVQLKASEMGPSVLYFFRFLKNHVLLKQVAEDKKKDHPFLRNSTYSYLNSGCSYLALDNMESLEESHPPLLSPEDELLALEQEQQALETPAAKPVDDLGLDFGGPSKSSSNYDMGLDFGAPTKSSSTYDMGLDFGAPTKSSSNYDMGLDFGAPTKSSNTYDMGLDFGAPTPKADDMGLDFGAPTKSSSTYDMGLDFGAPTKSSSTYDMGLDFGAPSTKADDMGLDFGTPVTTKATPKIEDLKSSKNLKNKLDREKISLFPIIDLELKTKLVMQVLIHIIVTARESNRWKESIGEFDQTLETLSAKHHLDKTVLVERLIQFCSNRQFFKQVMHLYALLGEDPTPFLDGACHSVLKSIFRMDEYIQTAQQSDHLLRLSQELYSCLDDIKQASLVVLSIYMMIFLAAWGYSRYDILKALFEHRGLQDLMQFVKDAPLYYRDLTMAEELSDEEDDDLDDKELLVKKREGTLVMNSLTKVFDLFCLKRFRKLYDSVVKDLLYHHIFDLIHQRIHFWLVAIQSKILSVPHSISECFYRKPINEAGEKLYELARKVRVFQTADRLDLWKNLTVESELIELVATTIMPDDAGVLPNGDSAMKQSTSSKRIQFDEEVELYKDGDLLQSFCVDVSSPDLQVVAVATTRGIREIDLKRASDHNRDDYEIDQMVGDTFMSPTQTRKLRISSKSVSSLNFKNKQNVFKSAFSSLIYLEVLMDQIVRCKFNQSGSKFGACDMAGNVLLWQFAAQEDTLRPFYTLQAHSKQTLDFTFLNSGSLLATAGISTDSKKDVCLWDVLLPPHKSLIASYTDQENGASSIAYSPKNQTIIVGGKKGSLSVYDIRTNRTLDNFKGHSLNTKSLALDPTEEFVASGSSDGNIKTWALPSLTCLDTFEDAHKKQTFVRPTGVFKSPVSTYGVIQVRIENNFMYSCGADGRLTMRKYLFKK
eukprot:gene8357-9815_t